MFGRQASSFSRTGTLLLLVLAIVSMRPTWSASVASDGAGKPANLNLSIVGSFRSFGMHLGGTTEKGGNDSVTMAPVNVTCVMHHEKDFEECTKQKVIKVDDITNFKEIMCKTGAVLYICGIKVACEYCSGDDLEKIKKAGELSLKADTEGVCKQWASLFPSSFSCTNWTLIIIIIAVVVLVALGILGVMVFCCCMGGKDRHGSRKSKHSSKRSSKSKLRKGSSKRRGSSRH